MSHQLHRGTEHALIAYAGLLCMFAMFLIFTQLTTPVDASPSPTLVTTYAIR